MFFLYRNYKAYLFYAKNKWLSSKYLQNVLKLMTGSLFSQIILFGATPLITRIYTAFDFGTFAIASSIAYCLSIISTGRYEMAIILPKQHKVSLSLLYLSVFISVFFTFFIFFGLILFSQFKDIVFNNLSIPIYFYLIPLMSFSQSLFSCFNCFSIRHQLFKELSIYKILYALMWLLFSVLFKSMAYGLIFAFVFSQLISVLFLIIALMRKNLFTKLKKQSLYKYIIFKYKSFPIYSTGTDLLSVLSGTAPVYLFGYFFSPAIVGYYALTERVLSAPCKLISSTVLDVFKQKSMESFHKFNNCRALFIKTAKTLSILAIFPFLILILFSPQLFNFIFGSAWKEAGVFSQVLAITYYLKFIINPLSYTYYMRQRLKEDFLMHVINLILLITTVSVVSYYWQNAIYSLLSFSALYSIIYAIYFWRSYVFSGPNG